ncbi:defensin-like protein 1 [Apium graveolens]|uniref:defensin-like protein 1 n=1 Tax=Apium graveolens TaxID=4045 RepID=UPI003D7ACBA1
MRANKRICQLLLLFILVLASQDILMREVEGGRTIRVCESQSHLFKGQCWSNSNCAQICRHEGFRGGHCRGFRKRCYCTKPCHGYHHHHN